LAHHLKISGEKIHVLGNAAGPAFSPLDHPPEKDDTAPPTLLCVASLDPRKNFHRLIEAWTHLTRSDRLPEGARLEIIGSTKPSNFSQFEIVVAPGIHWLGRVTDEDLIRHYRNATAFIFPSLYEGFGLPPIEAMACGCPVLLSRAASLPEVGGPAFEPDTPGTSSGAALYFDPQSIHEMAGCIEEMFVFDSKKRACLTKNAIARAAKFSWDTVADRTRKSIESL